MNDLPEDFAIELGRIVYHSAHADFLLGRLLARHEGAPEGRGLSGTRLVDGLRPMAEAHATLSEVVAGYEALYVWRNRLVHSTHSFGNETLWTWHVPIAGKGNSAQSFQLRLDHLRTMADGWQNLGETVHALLHEDDGESERTGSDERDIGLEQ